MRNQRHICEASGRAKVFALMNDTISRKSIPVPSFDNHLVGSNKTPRCDVRVYAVYLV